ncbi:leucine-rich repeat-containing protein 51-like [Antedon mediterranea]|uniref:leucine-rich repeat-containing protein 51-like n=1 Tax=Antedon mediterranea TaxID=105859 RepID=UPI003AF903B8
MGSTSIMDTTDLMKSPRLSATDSTNKVSSPLDFSFKGLTIFEDAHDEDPRKTQHKIKKDKEGKYMCTAVKFNNNALTEMSNFEPVLNKLIVEPSQLLWLDLSMNDFTKIDPVILNFKNLKMLYLHGNGIEDGGQVDKLSGLPDLITLTLHGNPMENERGYRHFILAKLPNLRSLDFSRVTKADRANAHTWKTMIGQKKKRRRQSKDE